MITVLTTRAALRAMDCRWKGWLHRAAESGDVDMTQWLVKKGAPVAAQRIAGQFTLSAPPVSAAYLAGVSGRTQVLKIIIDGQSDLKKLITNDPGSLYACAHVGHFGLVMKIIRALDYTHNLPAFQLPYEDISLIHGAAYGGNARIIRQFAKRRVDVRAITRCSLTALHVAAYKGNCHAIKLLVQFKVPINAFDDFGRTAWSIAEGRGHVKAAELLVKLGAQKKGCHHAEGCSFLFDQTECLKPRYPCSALAPSLSRWDL